jgi:hypothetical protein
MSSFSPLCFNKDLFTPENIKKALMMSAVAVGTVAGGIATDFTLFCTYPGWVRFAFGIAGAAALLATAKITTGSFKKVALGDVGMSGFFGGLLPATTAAVYATRLTYHALYERPNGRPGPGLPLGAPTS